VDNSGQLFATISQTTFYNNISNGKRWDKNDPICEVGVGWVYELNTYSFLLKFYDSIKMQISTAKNKENMVLSPS
jgi:hypothetical protein